jgi:RNA polymerase sigma-70 factor, ECF subfamily
MESKSSISVGPASLEAQLIKSIVGGDGRRFCELILPYQRQVYHVALRIVLNPSDAEQVVQETLISAYRNLHKFCGEAKFSTWLTSITINQARSRLRSQHRHRFSSITETVGTETGSITAAEVVQIGPSPLDIVEHDELQSIVWRAMKKIDQPYRTVFEMQVYEGHSIESAARALGITITATKTRLHRARRMLQTQLRPILVTMRQQPTKSTQCMTGRVETFTYATRVPVLAQAGSGLRVDSEEIGASQF